jgi:hypothetical protein
LKPISVLFRALSRALEAGAAILAGSSNDDRLRIDHSAGTSLTIVGYLFDLLMLILLLVAFAGAAVYILVCLDLTRPTQPPEGDAR